MARELSDELINDWVKLMNGISKCCKAQKGWKVVKTDSNIIVDNDFKIIAQFINFEFIRVTVLWKDEEYLEVRHIERYDHTAHPILNFISFNR